MMNQLARKFFPSNPSTHKTLRIHGMKMMIYVILLREATIKYQPLIKRLCRSNIIVSKISG